MWNGVSPPTPPAMPLTLFLTPFPVLFDHKYLSACRVCMHVSPSCLLENYQIVYLPKLMIEWDEALKASRQVKQRWSLFPPIFNSWCTVQEQICRDHHKSWPVHGRCSQAIQVSYLSPGKYAVKEELDIPQHRGHPSYRSTGSRRSWARSRVDWRFGTKLGGQPRRERLRGRGWWLRRR